MKMEYLNEEALVRSYATIVTDVCTVLSG